MRLGCKILLPFTLLAPAAAATVVPAPELLLDINPGPERSVALWSHTSDFDDWIGAAEFKGFAYFGARRPDLGEELWRTDGTPGGTELFADLHPGTGSSRPQGFTVIGDTMYFVAQNPFSRPLYKTDGTLAGTVPLTPMGWATGPVRPLGDGRVLFGFRPATQGGQLWMSDGTPEGTRLVRDIAASWEGLSTASMAGVVIFRAWDDETGSELWRSDGTAAGTYLLADIYSGTGSSAPNYLTVVGGTLFFTARDADHGLELWKTDGTAAGTVLVADIRPGGLGSLSAFNPLGVSGSQLLFPADDGVLGRELWKSDGTSAGTALVADIWPGPNSGAEMWDVDVIDGVVYFNGGDPEHGIELWRSDGSAAGTYRVADVEPGHYSSYAWILHPVGGLLFFNAETEHEGFELWVTDGTEAGTSLTADLYPGPGNSDAVAFLTFSDIVLIEARTPELGMELYTIDLGSPDEKLQRLLDEVLDLALAGGTEASLVAMLNAALAAYERENDEAAVAILNAFIHAVEAHRGLDIAPADADALIAEARRAIARLDASE